MPCISPSESISRLYRILCWHLLLASAPATIFTHSTHPISHVGACWELPETSRKFFIFSFLHLFFSWIWGVSCFLLSKECCSALNHVLFELYMEWIHLNADFFSVNALKAILEIHDNLEKLWTAHPIQKLKKKLGLSWMHKLYINNNLF